VINEKKGGGKDVNGGDQRPWGRLVGNRGKLVAAFKEHRGGGDKRLSNLASIKSTLVLVLCKRIGGEKRLSENIFTRGK